MTTEKAIKNYDGIFKENEKNKITEKVSINEILKEPVQLHYLPHRPVVREDKETTKIRAVFDASCLSDGPSLSGFLYSGPNLL